MKIENANQNHLIVFMKNGSLGLRFYFLHKYISEHYWIILKKLSLRVSKGNLLFNYFKYKINTLNYELNIMLYNR